MHSRSLASGSFSRKISRFAHTNAISDTDLSKIYSSLTTSVNSPTGLINKVQFDIRLYFFRRGSENMHGMTKGHFVIATDDKGQEYVATALDEMSKNHRGSSTQRAHGGKMMPAMPGYPLCPVASFRKYISKLHPLCPKLWQRVRNSFLDEEVWFCSLPVGEKTLQKFMPSLSQSCKVSQRHSNHCIRATGATILTKLNYHNQHR